MSMDASAWWWSESRSSFHCLSLSTAVWYSFTWALKSHKHKQHIMHCSVCICTDTKHSQPHLLCSARTPPHSQLLPSTSVAYLVLQVVLWASPVGHDCYIALLSGHSSPPDHPPSAGSASALWASLNDSDCQTSSSWAPSLLQHIEHQTGLSPPPDHSGTCLVRQ